MGTDKQYDGYESYDYLTAGDDYQEFELPGRHSGFEPYEIPLSDEEEKRARRVAAENYVVSFHEHPFYFPADLEADLWDYIRQGRAVTAYEYLADTALDGVFDMHFDGLASVHSQHGWKWDDIVHDVSMRACDIAHSEYAVRCNDVDDIRRAYDEGTLAVVPSLESAAMIENELDRIEQLYGIGVRLMGITYTASNALGTGEGGIHERDGGLTAFGAEAVERMNMVGMAVSTSHSSPQTTLDVCEVSDEPVFDTHALARGAGVGQRGASDEELTAIADTGGIIGILSSTHLPDIETYMDHFEYIVGCVGIDHVAFGPDLLYGDHTALLKVLSDFHGIELPETTLENPYVKGLENPTEAWNNIIRWLVTNDYTDEEIEKVLGENILRALDESW